MPVLRVLHILPHRGGGGEVYVSALESAPDLVHERFYLSSGRSPADAVRSLPRQYPRVLQRALAADVIHVHGDAAAILTLPLLARRPAVITSHGLHLLRRRTGLARLGFEFGLRGAVAVSEATITTSDAERRELESVVRARDIHKLRTILNGVEPQAPVAEETRQEIRRSLGVAPQTVLALFAGELESRKDPLLAVAAARRVRAAGHPFRLMVAGRGPLAPAIERQTDDAVQLLGHRKDLSRLMAGADIFLQTAVREGMSLAVLEALSHGLTIIASDVPANVEAIGDAGTFFPVGDEDALVDAVLRLAEDAELRSELSSRARLRARERFGAERFAAETAEIYRSLRLHRPQTPR